ncbi:MAG: ribosomal-processing cysteine protease Prp [Oenococcus sp.]|uniref:ribosomal-processing cysteine protease Prp n=1 Tax=Oenococcus sp. TaxID=1979414 RepID=UPI0039E91214
MIQIVVKQIRTNKIRISLSGHAMSGVYGHDIVCAAISVLLDHTATHLSKKKEIDNGVTYQLTAYIQNKIDKAFVDALIDELTELAVTNYPKYLVMLKDE